MPLNLPANLIAEKNKISTDSAWIILLTVEVDEENILRLANNNEDIVFQGETYVSFPFLLDANTSDETGTIPTLTLRVSNINRGIQYYLEEYGGAVGATVNIVPVNTNYLEEDYDPLELTFEVLSSSSDVHWVSFSLGTPNPLNQRYPLYKYMASSCNWVNNFKGVECAYSGTLTTCNGTFSDCEERNNTQRFGGYRGLDEGNMRFV